MSPPARTSCPLLGRGRSDAPRLADVGVCTLAVGVSALASLRAPRPAEVSDRTDGKLVHLDGLNLSRAWMLFGIAAALPDSSQPAAASTVVPTTWPTATPFPAGISQPLKLELLRLAVAHRDAGLAALSSQSYEGGHWLGSFATICSRVAGSGGRLRGGTGAGRGRARLRTSGECRRWRRSS